VLIQYNEKREWLYVLLLAMVQFIHLVDFVIIMPLGPRFMSDFQITPTQFASLVSSYNFAAGTSAILLGTFADKFDRKKLLVLMAFGLGFGTVLCGLADSFATLITARIMAGAFGGMVGALILAIVADIVPYERRGKAMGVLMTAFSVASVIGLPIGLLIADTYGWETCFFVISGIVFLISLIIFVTFPNLISNEKGIGGLKVIKRYYEFVFVKGYGLSFVFIFSVSMSMFMIIPFLAPYAVKNMGIAVEEIKYMYLAGGLCTILTARFIGVLTDRWGALKSYVLVAVVSIAPILLYTNAGPMSLVPYLLIGSFFMIMVSGRMIPCMTLISAVPSSEERGGYMGVVNSLRAFGSASATFIGGFIISESANGQLVGFSKAGLLAIAVTLLSCGLGFFLAKKVSFTPSEKLPV
jgi:predicted MFS family arabinose efflux permease